jgi:uncharacterized membrane protein YhaH (DUF805 family)
MSVFKLLFTAQGRIGRRAYLAGAGGLLGVAVAAGAFTASAGPVGETVSIAVTVALVYPLICVNTKRLHDLGRTGSWQILVNLGATMAHRLILGPWLGEVAGAALVALIYLAFYGGLAVAPGDPKRNGYGEPPDGRVLARAAQVFE